MNMKSHQMAYKKLERDLEAAIKYVDYEDSKLLNTTQIGQLFYVIGVFRYMFNEEFNRQQMLIRSRLEKKLSQAEIKVEERKLREEEFLMQFWLKINPGNDENVDA